MLLCLQIPIRKRICRHINLLGFQWRFWFREVLEGKLKSWTKPVYKKHPFISCGNCFVKGKSYKYSLLPFGEKGDDMFEMSKLYEIQEEQTKNLEERAKDFKARNAQERRKDIYLKDVNLCPVEGITYNTREQREETPTILGPYFR